MIKSCSVEMMPLPDFVGFGAEDPGPQGLLHKVCVINEGQGEDVCNMHCMDILHKLSLP